MEEKEIMTKKELEKHNFLTWYRDATAKELEKVKEENNEVWERLNSEYAGEIELIYKIRKFNKSLKASKIEIGNVN